MYMCSMSKYVLSPFGIFIDNIFGWNASVEDCSLLKHGFRQTFFFRSPQTRPLSPQLLLSYAVPSHLSRGTPIFASQCYCALLCGSKKFDDYIPPSDGIQLPTSCFQR